MDGDTERPLNVPLNGDRSHQKGDEHPLHRLLDHLGVGLFVLLTVVAGMQITFRFVLGPYFDISVAWTGEAARFLLVYVTMLGAVIASRDADHIQIKVLLNRLSVSRAGVLRLLIHVLSLTFLCIAVYAGYLSTIDNINVQPGAVPLITLEYVFVALLIGFLAMAYYELRWLIRDARSLADTVRTHE